MRCSDCGLDLLERENTPFDSGKPCPRCGSRNRLFAHTFTASQQAQATLTKTVTRSLTASVTALVRLKRVVLGARLWIYARTQILVRPPSPEPAYHQRHEHHDGVSSVVVPMMALALLVASLVNARRSRLFG